MTQKSLAGFWTGSYDFADETAPVEFTLTLHENNGAIHGEIIEPDTDDPARGHIFASFSGNIAEDIISFDKIYENDKIGSTMKLRYTGFANDEGNYIEGSWNYLLKHGGHWNSGNFKMKRKAIAISYRTLIDRESTEKGND